MDINTKQGMQAAKDWTQRLIDTLNDGGTWMVPRSGTILRFDKVSRIANIVYEMTPDTSIKQVLTAMGWTVTKKAE